jgi:hypothetical protein
MKDDERGKGCDSYGGKREIYSLLVGTVGRIILKLISQKLCRRF